MNPGQIKHLRTQSLLKELIPEALSQLGNTALHELSVLEVILSKGRSDAKVYLDPSFCTKEEEAHYLKQIRKATGAIEAYIKNDQGWYKSPKLTFEFDRELEYTNKMDALFAKARADLGIEDQDEEK